MIKNWKEHIDKLDRSKRYSFCDLLKTLNPSTEEYDEFCNYLYSRIWSIEICDDVRILKSYATEEQCAMLDKIAEITTSEFCKIIGLKKNRKNEMKVANFLRCSGCSKYRKKVGDSLIWAYRRKGD